MSFRTANGSVRDRSDDLQETLNLQRDRPSLANLLPRTKDNLPKQQKQNPPVGEAGVLPIITHLEKKPKVSSGHL